MSIFKKPLIDPPIDAFDEDIRHFGKIRIFLKNSTGVGGRYLKSDLENLLGERANSAPGTWSHLKRQNLNKYHRFPILIFK